MTSPTEATTSTHGFRGYVGLDVQQEGTDTARVVLRAEARHLNPHGSVHGGVLATMADVAMGEAVAASGGGLGVTIELKVTYLRPGQPGEIVATARVIKRGKQITIIEAEITQDDEMVAHAIGTFTSGS